MAHFFYFQTDHTTKEGVVNNRTNHPSEVMLAAKFEFVCVCLKGLEVEKKIFTTKEKV